MSTPFAEMFFDAGADGAPVSVDEQGLMWKPVLRTGVWDVGPNGRPLRVVAGASHDPKSTIGMQDIVDNYNAGAVEHVTVPVTHNDTVEENRGFVKGLKIAQAKDGTSFLMAGHHITEPDTAAKIKRGTIANTSVGLEFDYVRKEDGKKFPIILRHVALTNRPWINRLTPFGMNASDAPEDGYEICSMEFSERLTEMVDGIVADTTVVEAPVEEVNPTESIESTSVSPDIITTSTTSEDDTVPKPDEDKTPVVPTDPVADADVVTPVQLSELTTQLAESKTEADRMREQLNAQAKQIRTNETEKLVEQFKSIGLSEENGCGAFLVAVRNICLADEGQGVLMLSEGDDAPAVPVSATDIVKRLVNALPSDETTGKLKAQFSEQAVAAAATEKPAATADPEGEGDDVQLSEEDFDAMHAALFPSGTSV